MRRVVVAITLCAATAYADPEQAKQLVTDAEALVAAGDFLGAAAKFRAAYKAEPLPEHICNTGVAFHKAQDLPRSHRYLNLCVTMGSALDPAYRETLRTTVEGIQAKLVTGEFTPFDIVVDPQTAVVSFDANKPFDEELVGGGRIWLPYGTYRIVVRADGYVDATKDVTANGHDAIPLRIDLARQQRPEVKPPAQVDTTTRRSTIPAIIASSATISFGIAALVLMVQADSFIDDAEAQTDRTKFDQLHDKAHTRQRAAWIVGGLAGAGAVASAILWYRVLRAPARVEVTATGDGGAVSISGRF